jgi:hypothetical protein
LPPAFEVVLAVEFGVVAEVFEVVGGGVAVAADCAVGTQAPPVRWW